MTIKCEYCEKPITEGEVQVTQIDGREVYFHQKIRDVKNIKPYKDINLFTMPVEDCATDYMWKNLVAMILSIVPFSQLEKATQ